MGDGLSPLIVSCGGPFAGHWQVNEPEALWATLFPGLFPFELGRREKTLASVGHVPILHPKILGVIN